MNSINFHAFKDKRVRNFIASFLRFDPIQRVNCKAMATQQILLAKIDYNIFQARSYSPPITPQKTNINFENQFGPAETFKLSTIVGQHVEGFDCVDFPEFVSTEKFTQTARPVKSNNFTQTEERPAAPDNFTQTPAFLAVLPPPASPPTEATSAVEKHNSDGRSQGVVDRFLEKHAVKRDHEGKVVVKGSVVFCSIDGCNNSTSIHFQDTPRAARVPRAQAFIDHYKRKHTNNDSSSDADAE